VENSVFVCKKCGRVYPPFWDGIKCEVIDCNSTEFIEVEATVEKVFAVVKKIKEGKKDNHPS
jgi:hypothetical protein